MGDTTDYYTDFDYYMLGDPIDAFAKSYHKPRKNTDKFWILWNPSYEKPPRVKFYSKKEAEATAELMARKTGDIFFVLESKSRFEKEPAPISKTEMK